MTDQLITLGVEAMAALARLDVAAHGFATPRVHFARAGAVESLEWSPGAALAVALERVPTDQRVEMARLHYVEQLTGGRKRVAALLEHAGGMELPRSARMFIVYMDPLPADLRHASAEVGCWIEVWHARERRIVRRGVMPLLRGNPPQLRAFTPTVDAVEFPKSPRSALN